MFLGLEKGHIEENWASVNEVSISQRPINHGCPIFRERVAQTQLYIGHHHGTYHIHMH